MTEAQAQKIVDVLEEAYGKKVSPTRRKIFLGVLARHDYTRAKKGVAKHVTERKWFPNPAEFIESMDAASPVRRQMPAEPDGPPGDRVTQEEARAVINDLARKLKRG